MRALYFGYTNGGGHFLRLPDGRLTLNLERDVPGLPWRMGLLDTGLLKNGKIPDKPDGRVFWLCGGISLWHAFIWWDRSGDKRGASNSGFYVEGFTLDERIEAFEYAKKEFPHVVSRQHYPLVLSC